MTHDETYTYRLFVDTTLLDGDRYGAALEIIMDKVAEAFAQMQAEGLAVRVHLTDTSTIENTVLDLDGLDDEGVAHYPQTEAEAQTCPHGNRVWFGNECGLCGA